MTMNSYDVIVIGTGQAGPFVANRFAKAGMKVAIVERGLFGGTCVNTGCIPTKTMIASAYAAHMARRAAEFGVGIAGDVTVDMARVKARKDAISGQSRAGVEAGLRKTENCTVYQGHARFESQRVVKVGSDRITAERIFINVGGRALIPSMPGLAHVPFLTNSSMMEVDFIPEHLVIVGGSYIGLEFGQMFRRFGSQVTIVEMSDRLIRREDEDISASILEVIEGEGIHVRLNAKCISVSTHGANVVASVDCTEGAPDVTGSHLLLAVGRRPNTDDLGLDAAGVAVDERGYIVVDDELRTSVPWHLGARGLQWEGRVHAHVVQRRRDRRREPARGRYAPGQRSHSRLRPVRRSAARPRGHDGSRSARDRPSGARRQARHEGREARRREG